MSASPAVVGKPADAGAAKTAIANTRLAYVNIRTGPGTNYQDIGDIFDNTLVDYYPATRTADGWVWLEQGNLRGWVSTTVVEFEDVSEPSHPPSTDPTPYDGKVALWHWKGDVLPESTIDDVARNIKQQAPHVTDLFVKTSDYTPRSGARWQGYWDSKRELAIDGPQSIDQWVQVLGRYGMSFHAWCVPRGLDIVAETNLIIEACQRPGVKSMILDIEPYDGFWSGGRDGIRPFMLRIRQAIPGSFHIGLAVDPRSHHYHTIFPDEWYPFVNSVHPMAYWATFRRTPADTLEETYRVWGGFGRPIIPILQGDAEVSDMRTAHTLSVQRYGAAGLSWWRLGVIGPMEWPAVNQPITPGTQPPTPEVPPVQYGDEQVVRPDSRGFAKGSYTGQNEFRSFLGTWGWQIYYKNTEPRQSKVWVQWSPQLPRSGKYEISAFVPQRRATTHNARYKIHGVVGGSREVQVAVDQSRYRNSWVTLGVFEIDKGAVNAGSVFINDLTYESNLSIAFDAIRWREVLEGGGSGDGPIADGFDSPVGTAAQRAGTQVWPSGWRDATGFGYDTDPGYLQNFGAYHTGVDLNVGPSGNADIGVPVYSPASGVVIYQASLRPWGNVTIIRHDPLKSVDGRVYYSRYGHMQNVRVQVGERVARGDQVGEIGTGEGRYIAHLHYDISPTTVLERSPGDWPGKDINRLLRDYIDPLEFTRKNRPR